MWLKIAIEVLTSGLFWWCVSVAFLGYLVYIELFHPVAIIIYMAMSLGRGWR